MKKFLIEFYEQEKTKTKNNTKNISAAHKQ